MKVVAHVDDRMVLVQINRREFESLTGISTHYGNPVGSIGADYDISPVITKINQIISAAHNFKTAEDQLGFVLEAMKPLKRAVDDLAAEVEGKRPPAAPMLILRRGDLIPSVGGVAVAEIELLRHFKSERLADIEFAGVIIFVDSDGESRVLKDRDGVLPGA